MFSEKELNRLIKKQEKKYEELARRAALNKNLVSRLEGWSTDDERHRQFMKQSEVIAEKIDNLMHAT